MANLWLYTILSVVIVSLISFVGILTLTIKQKNLNKFLIYFVSFAAGALFGDAFIHLIPEAIEKVGLVIQVPVYILLGITFSFIAEKIIQWRHCHGDQKCHPFAYMNLLGDGVHNLIDGLIIASSYLVSIPIGLATTLAVIFHEIPQEVGDFGVLLHGGFTKSKALLLNFLSALTAVAGAVIALLLNNFIPNMTNFLIPFAAGTFVYIAGSDLIPELHKELSLKKSFIQLILFVLGIFVIYSLTYI